MGTAIAWWPFDIVNRGLRVAYAGHARAVLEFFHDGRLNRSGDRKRRERRPDGDIDVQLYDYTEHVPGAIAWTTDHLDRLGDADKLLAHLSTGRLAPARRVLPEWGEAADRTRFRQVVEQIMQDVPNSATLFIGTARALRET